MAMDQKITLSYVCICRSNKEMIFMVCLIGLSYDEGKKLFILQHFRKIKPNGIQPLVP